MEKAIIKCHLGDSKFDKRNVTSLFLFMMEKSHLNVRFKSKFHKHYDLRIQINWYDHEKNIFKCDSKFDERNDMKIHIVSVHVEKRF